MPQPPQWPGFVPGSGGRRRGNGRSGAVAAVVGQGLGVGGVGGGVAGFVGVGLEVDELLGVGAVEVAHVLVMLGDGRVAVKGGSKPWRPRWAWQDPLGLCFARLSAAVECPACPQDARDRRLGPPGANGPRDLAFLGGLMAASEKQPSSTGC